MRNQWNVKYLFTGAIILAVIPAMLCLFTNHAWGKTTPVLNSGEKWRIGYYEGGPYSDYVKTMNTLIIGLMDLGWLEKNHLPKFEDDKAKPYWNWLADNSGAYLSFSPMDAYSAEWDEKKREKIKTKLLKKLKKGTLDLIIAMGTWAGQDLANNQHRVPTVVLSTSDPIKAGIVKSIEDSGLDHVTARVDPWRYLRQLRMFHRIVGFKKLGVAYEDTPEGRIYSALDEINQVATERGFSIVKCTVKEINVEEEVADESCLQCYQQLSRQADAIYVTSLTCVDRNLEEYVGIFKDRKIPTFSMSGSPFVKKGLLLSISSDSGFMRGGTYNAEKIAEILNGAKPRDLKQMFEASQDISINLDTAKKIDFPVPESLLKIAREVYAQ